MLFLWLSPTCEYSSYNRTQSHDDQQKLNLTIKSIKSNTPNNCDDLSRCSRRRKQTSTMGAKPSTANGTQSPRTRTFSTSSSSEAVTAPGLRFMQSLGMDVGNDRQRARSLSSVPDLHGSPEALQAPATSFDLPADVDGSANDETAAGTASLAFGHVYTAHSLPSHIWSLNDIKCPVCNRFVIPDDIECHLVMCLTKPRLSYNEDVLTDDKGEECVICLEDLSQGDVIARLPCLCIYHKTCIDQWFEVNRSCPEHPGD